MSWTDHLSEEDREDLENKAIDDLVVLVRMGFLEGGWYLGQRARVAAELEELRVHPMVKSRINAAMQPQIEDVVRNLYKKMGRPGIDHLAWLEGQYQSYRKWAEDLFINHR